MAVLKESLLVTLLISLYRACGKAWHESNIGRFFRLLLAKIKSSSVLYAVRRETKLNGSWENSILCRFCGALMNIVNVIIRAIYRAGKKLFDGSCICSGLTYLSDRMYVLLGLFFAVVFIVPHDYWNNVYAFGAIVLLFVLYGFSFAKSGKRINVSKSGPFMPMLLIIVLYSCISSVSISLSLRFLLFYVTCALTVLLVVTTADDERKLTKLVACVLAAVTAAGIFGCIQRIVGVKVVENQVDLTLELNKNMPGRIPGTFGNPNNFAELLVLTIPFYVAMLLNAKTRIGKEMAILGMIPPVVAILMTYSRSGWIGLALAILIFIAFKNWRVLPVVIIIALLALPLLPRSIMNRILTIGNMQDSSTNYRFMIMETYSQMLGDVWPHGIGLGSDSVFVAVKSYKQLINGKYPVHAHNNYLQMIAEMGILGLLSYIAMMFCVLKESFKLVFKPDVKTECKNFALAGCVALIGLLVISLAEYTWFYPRVMFAFWLVLGITMAANKMRKTAADGTTEENNER